MPLGDDFWLSYSFGKLIAQSSWPLSFLSCIFLQIFFFFFFQKLASKPFIMKPNDILPGLKNVVRLYL